MSVKETTGTENSIMIQICQLLINYSINLKKTKLNLHIAQTIAAPILQSTYITKVQRQK
jgi:hypothetical protein